MFNHIKIRFGWILPLLYLCILILVLALPKYLSPSNYLGVLNWPAGSLGSVGLGKTADEGLSGVLQIFVWIWCFGMYMVIGLIIDAFVSKLRKNK